MTKEDSGNIYLTIDEGNGKETTFDFRTKEMTSWIIVGVKRKGLFRKRYKLTSFNWVKGDENGKVIETIEGP